MSQAEKHLASCLEEGTALDFVEGRLGPALARTVDEHLDTCPACRLLVRETVKTLRERRTEEAGAPLPTPGLTRFREGEELGGRYRIIRFIARGGMGEVYEVKDRVLNTRVALKTLAAPISDDAEAIRRFKQEVYVARQITHPNVCRIFDLGVHEPPSAPANQAVYFITMELMSGESLGHRIRSKGAIAALEARPIVDAMVAALGAAHRAGIVHRDFKSDNVMLADPSGTEEQRVVVMDFGLARPAATTGKTSGWGWASAVNIDVNAPTVAGTAAYMAPEQVLGQVNLPGTDMYALGVVMFEMLTGRLPFPGESPVVMMSKRLVEDPPSVGELVPGLDPRWETVIGCCLERDPQKRFRSMTDLVAALDAPSSIKSEVTTPVRVRSRKKAVIVATTATVALLLSLAVAIGRRGWTAKEPRPAAIVSRPVPAAAPTAPPAAKAPPVVEAPQSVVTRQAPPHPTRVARPATPAAKPAAKAPPRRSSDPDDGFYK